MFGFGKGKIEIQLNKYGFSLGETINGKVSLKLKKPIKARGVNIRLVGIRKETRYSDSGKTSGSNNIFDFKQPLDGLKEYGVDEKVYDFKIKIPNNVLTQPKFGQSTIGTLVGAAQILSGTMSSINWYLIANLDIVSGIDISKKVQINIA